MTQRDKQQLLLKELCTRQSWGVKVQYNNKVYAIDYVSAEYEEVKLDIPDNYTVGISDIKPYLRPMSSMTEKEKIEYERVRELDTEIILNYLRDGTTPFPVLYHSQDYLNSIHVDYRGLIPMGLAIEVTKENNPYKELKL